MKKHTSTYLFLLFCLLFLCKFNKANGFIIDSLKVKERCFNSKSIDEYKSMDEFQYHESITQSEGNPIWEAILRFLGRLFDMNVNGNNMVIWKYLLYGLIAVFILFLILKISGADRSWFLHSRENYDSLILSEDVESIKGIDFNSIITKAIENKEYRKAIRYFYLFSLQILSDKNLIEWKPEKTNNDYLNELKPQSLKSTFKDNTLIYEYIYYGDFKINESSFNQAKISFEEFISSIKKVK